MISSLRGEVIDKGLDYVVIECGGVGYHCLATGDTLASLRRGEQAFVYTSLVIRDDAHTLYAFSTPEQRHTFGILQKVSGVGARLAMGVMSVLQPADIARAVEEGDTKTLQQAPGVGKRLADRMAVDLKGKFPSLEVGADQATIGDIAPSAAADEAMQSQVVEALVGLGFTESKAATAVKKILAEAEPGSADASSVLREALQRLSGQKR